MSARPRRDRVVLSLGDGDVHVWPVRRRTGEDPVAEVFRHYRALAGAGIVVPEGGGKPRLADPGTDARFSVAHADGLSLVVVAGGREVGVDVERLERAAWLSLPGHALAPSELQSFEGLTGRARAEAFLRLWVRKEAVLKAAGVGLAVEPSLVTVTGPAESPAVLAVPAEIGPAARWGLADVLLPGYAAAVAVERPHAPPLVQAGSRQGGRPLMESLRTGHRRLTSRL